MLKAPYSSDDFNQTSLNLIRSGTVIDRRMGSNGPEVRVAYGDRGVTSDWLPVSQPSSGGMSFHFCPRKGANVLVAHIGTGIEHGSVIGSSPTQNGGAVIPNSLNSVAILADDGAQFEYNPDSGQLLAGGVKTIKIVGAATITVVTGGDVDLTAGGNLNANVSGNAVIVAANVNIQGGTITLQGNVIVTGSLDVKGSTTLEIGGTTLSGHLTNADGAGGGA
jgi:phage baseplate assembly protein V